MTSIIRNIKIWLMSEEWVRPGDMSWDTGLYIVTGCCTFLLWGFFTYPSLIIAFLTYCLCSYYAQKWGIKEKFPCVIASLMWLATLIFWYRIYQINETNARLRIVEDIMES